MSDVISSRPQRDRLGRRSSSGRGLHHLFDDATAYRFRGTGAIINLVVPSASEANTLTVRTRRGPSPPAARGEGLAGADRLAHRPLALRRRLSHSTWSLGGAGQDLPRRRGQAIRIRRRPRGERGLPTPSPPLDGVGGNLRAGRCAVHQTVGTVAVVCPRSQKSRIMGTPRCVAHPLRRPRRLAADAREGLRRTVPEHQNLAPERTSPRERPPTPAARPPSPAGRPILELGILAAGSSYRG